MTTFVLTLIGDDRPGLVSELSAVVTAHGGNWRESRLTQMAGKFAGVVLVDVASDRLDSFDTAIADLRGSGLTVTASSADDDAVPEVPDAPMLSINIVGNDQPGIVAQVSQALAGLGATIEELTSFVSEAPMSGGMLFQAYVAAQLPDGVEAAAVREVLEPIAGELMIDIDIEDDEALDELLSEIGE